MNVLCQEPFEEGFPSGEEFTTTETLTQKEASDSKGGTVKFGWIKGVLVSF